MLVALEPGLQLSPDDGQGDGIVPKDAGQEVIGLGADCVFERDCDLVGETPSLAFQAADVALGLSSPFLDPARVSEKEQVLARS